MQHAPEWARGLRGFERVTFEDHGEVRVPIADRAYAIEIVLPSDLAAMATDIDPLIPAFVVANAIRSLEERLGELVRLSRAEGHSWAKIGQAIGVARQTAWEKYSGEE